MLTTGSSCKTRDIRFLLLARHMDVTAVASSKSPRDKLGARPVEQKVCDWLFASTCTVRSDDSSEGAIEKLMQLYSRGQQLPQALVLEILDVSMVTHRQLPNVLQISRTRTSTTASNDAIIVPTHRTRANSP